MKPDLAVYHRLIDQYEQPGRRAVSSRFPLLKPIILFCRVIFRKASNFFFVSIARRKGDFFSCVVARHQSVLIRKLGDSDVQLQRNKIINLKRACQDLDGLIIGPGQVFSLWEVLGRPTYARGYVDGMLLSQGKIIRGVGGGLCQLSNFLCWLLLHGTTKIVERYHHSLDTFPDSGRVLPFGSGATCLYNFVDLKVQNKGDQPLQIKIWVTETHLRGQLLSPMPQMEKYSLREIRHYFLRKKERYFRSNEIWRLKNIHGKEISREKIFFNFAPVLYSITPEYIEKNNFSLIDMDHESR